MSNVENLQINGISYPIRDKNTLRSLSSDRYNEVITYGKYNGEDVNIGEVFTNEEGKFQKFSKSEKPSETSFSEKVIFSPDGKTTQSPYWITKITKENGNETYDFYMAIGAIKDEWDNIVTKSYTSLDGVEWDPTNPLTPSGDPVVSTDSDCTPYYNNGYWIVKNSYGNNSYSNDDGKTWVPLSSNYDPSFSGDYGVAGEYFFCTNGSLWLSTTGHDWNQYSISGASSLTYNPDENIYVLLADGKIYTNENPSESSWEEVTVETALWGSIRRIRYINGTYYILSNGYSYDGETQLVSKSINLVNWTPSETYIPDNGWFDGHLLFVMDNVTHNEVVLVERSNGEIYISKNKGQTFELLTTGNGFTSIVDNELLQIYDNEIYSLNPVPSWEYKLEDLGSLTSIAVAGKGIKFETPTVKERNFEIVGDLNIEDGIVSGFSENDYITINIPGTGVNNDNYEFYVRLKLNNTPAQGDTVGVLGSTETGENRFHEPRFLINEYNSFYTQFSNNGEEYTTQCYTDNNRIPVGEWITVKVLGTYIRESTGYRHEVYTTTDGVTFINDWGSFYHGSDSGCKFNLSNLCLGAAAKSDSISYFDGSIDLNETYIIVNGEVVWKAYTETSSTDDKLAISLDANLSDFASAGKNISIGKTLKRVKTNFMNVSAPTGRYATVTEDGIAGPFYTSNGALGYIGGQLPDLGYNWSIYFKLIPNSYSRGSKVFSIGTTSSSNNENSYVSCFINNNGTGCYIKVSTDKSTLCVDTSGTPFAYIVNQPCYLKVTSDEYDGVFVYASNSGYEEMNLIGQSYGIPVRPEKSMFYIGDIPFCDQKHSIDGQIDLNEIRVEKDGEVIWTPYTFAYVDEISAGVSVNSSTTSDLKTYSPLETISDGVANVTQFGYSSNVDDLGRVSDINYSNYVYCPYSFYPSSGDSWEMNFGIKTSDDVTTKQFILGCRNYNEYRCPVIAIENGTVHLWLSSDGTSWDIADDVYGGNIYPNTNYQIRLVYNGIDRYILYLNNGIISTIYNSSTIYGPSSDIMAFGINQVYGYSNYDVFRGIINLRDCYIIINGENVWKGFITNDNIALYCNDFTGSKAGLVPKPNPSQTSNVFRFLNAQGSWTRIRAEYIEETETINL